MSKQRNFSNKKSNAIERRGALKTLGAFALYACSSDPEGNERSGSPAARDQGTNGDAGSSSASSGQGSPDSGPAETGGATDAGAPSDSGAMPSHVDASSPATMQDAGADAGVMQVGDAGASTSGLLPPMFSDAPTCTLTATDSAGEGPFFIHEDEVMTDPTLKRVDMRDGREGVELQLNYRLLDADGNCMKPIADVEVYTWHTDALGLYSGFNGQNPDQTYMGGGERTVENMERFCRGMQLTNAEGVASFRSIYPGWYFGRPIHIHFVALRKGSKAEVSSYRSAQFHIFTTQLYFEEQFSRKIHENNAPYTKRTSGDGYAMYVKPNAQSMVRPSARMEGKIVVASLNIITKASGSRR